MAKSESTERHASTNETNYKEELGRRTNIARNILIAGGAAIAGWMAINTFTHGGIVSQPSEDETGADPALIEQQASTVSHPEDYMTFYPLGDYTVQEGDTLYSIASRYTDGITNSINMTMDIIKENNPDKILDGTGAMVMAGDVIQVPISREMIEISK